MNEVKEQLLILKTDKIDIKTQNILSKIEKYINENLAIASIEGLSGYLGYSNVYTATLVKKVMGETYTDYLHKKRLKKAAELLLETELSVGEVVKAVGYENENYFRKLFKERYGKKPLQYRKMEGK